MTKIITIANRKGGVGKSTCIAHFAFEASKKYRTILLDLDPQKTLEKWWKKRKSENPFLSDVTPNDLQQKLSYIDHNGFDFCFIDTPGDTSVNSIESIKVADLVIVPCKPTTPDLEAIGRTISELKVHNKEYVFIITQSIPNSNTSFQASSVLSEFGALAPNTFSNRISYVKAMAIGESAANFDKNAESEIDEIWKFIQKRMNVNYEQEDTKRKI